MILGLVLLFDSLLLVVKSQRKEVCAEQAAQIAGQAVKQQILTNIQIQKPDAQMMIPKKEPQPLTVQEIDGYPYIGAVVIPRLNLELPVMASLTDHQLNIAPCRQFGETTRDMVIAGHNYRGHFRNLGELIQGDSIIFTDMAGMQTTYEVCTVGDRNRIMAGCQISEKTA